MPDWAQLQADFNRNRIDFLNIDAETALTMAGIALGADADPEKRSRNTRNARRAYDAILYFSQRCSFTPTQLRDLRGKLAQLVSALRQLGEVL